MIDISHKSVKHRDAQLTLEDITDWEDTYGRIPDNSIVLMNSGSSKLYKDPKRYFGYPDEEKLKITWSLLYLASHILLIQKHNWLRSRHPINRLWSK